MIPPNVATKEWMTQVETRIDELENLIMRHITRSEGWTSTKEGWKHRNDGREITDGSLLDFMRQTGGTPPPF